MTAPVISGTYYVANPESYVFYLYPSLYYKNTGTIKSSNVVEPGKKNELLKELSWTWTRQNVYAPYNSVGPAIGPIPPCAHLVGLKDPVVYSDDQEYGAAPGFGGILFG